MLKYILETPRLNLREFNPEDAGFIVELVNTPGWLEFIGDRNVRTKEHATYYIENGPMKSYRENGFGLYLVETKDTNTCIGMCGILKRDTLENPDIGFAFLPEYTGKGYAIEIARATLEYAQCKLGISRMSGITDPANERSIHLLENLGMKFDRSVYVKHEGKLLSVYSTD